ncbi:MAG: tRNA pseudouridine(55) synthase TruB [Chloroflexi bacterium]|nr:tRNA pseudouridine(55) synthase TruB [Chloroflexota bacterium]
MDAIFNVYKPKGPTSHDVVARLRHASGVRRLGHAGTLDPLAEGVLVVAVGQATRLVEYLAAYDKAYRAQVTLGAETDTYDAEGTVVAERSIAHLDAAAIEAALSRFRGVIRQRPPAYSAVSVGGRRLYELARQGKAVEAPVRQVEITRLELETWRPPVATLYIECSKGTYIRTLAHDLGAALSCGGHLSRLIRTRVGRFTAEDAVPPAELEEMLRKGTWPVVAVDPAVAVEHLPAVILGSVEAARLANGSAITAAPESVAILPGALGRALGPDGRLLAIVRLDKQGGRRVWRPEKVLARPA